MPENNHIHVQINVGRKNSLYTPEFATYFTAYEMVWKSSWINWHIPSIYIDKKPVRPFDQGIKVARVLLFPVRTVSKTVFQSQDPKPDLMNS